MSAVAVLPSRLSVDAAWQRYTALIRKQTDDPTLCASLQHCQEVARAWAVWRDAYLAMDR